MRGFFERLNLSMAEFMQGRYGNDNLNMFLIGVAVAFIVLSMFIPFASFVSWIFIAVVIWRMLSKNHAARSKANEKYKQIVKGPKRAFKI